MRKLLIALIAVALMSIPAYASVQNIKISGDIDSTFVVRDTFDLGTGQSTSYSQDFLMTQTRLRVDADLTENVSAVVGLINERAWDQETGTANDTDIDLNLAYVELREMLYSPLTVVIGRQNFSYGNSFVVDSAGVNNRASVGSGLSVVAQDLTKRTAQDAVRLILDYDPLTIELLASKVDANNLLGTGAEDDDVDLFGINGNYQLGDDWNSEVEGYFFARIDQSLKANATGTKADTLYVPGLRASSNPIKGLNVQLEYARQLGTKATSVTAIAPTSRADNMERDAWGTQFVSSYVLPFEKTAEYNPIVSTSYTYVSGDKNPAAARANSDDWTAWDPLFENQAGGTIYNSLFALTNCHVASISSQVNPIEDVTLKATWTGLWLSNSINPNGAGHGVGGQFLQILQPDSNAFIQPTVTSNRDIGYEIDVGLMYDYTEDVQLGLNMGWFVPGDLFNAMNKETANQYLANVNVNF